MSWFEGMRRRFEGDRPRLTLEDLVRSDGFVFTVNEARAYSNALVRTGGRRSRDQDWVAEVGAAMRAVAPELPLESHDRVMTYLNMHYGGTQ